MSGLTPEARPKVKEDTFFLPVSSSGVYFRNNIGTFQMEGEMIDRWMEKLIPMFNGWHTLSELTAGLTPPYRMKVYEIANVLYEKGFVRDASVDRPHQLPAHVAEKYAAQILFLESFGDSGAYRFECYRQASVLAVGSGPMFVSLISALLESGLTSPHMLITGRQPTNRERIGQLTAHARRDDSDVGIREIGGQPEGVDGWREAVRPYEAIVYASQEDEGGLERFRQLHAACKAEGKLLIPALILEQTGMAGPVVHPQFEGCWESAWRRVHRPAVSKDPQLHAYSPTAGAVLANVAAFELFKTMAGLRDSKNAVFLLNLETLEGSWHAFMPHPLVREQESFRPARFSPLDTERSDHGEQHTYRTAHSRLLAYWSGLASGQSGIFHDWAEGDLRQLPLALCRVEAADPLSEGPAALLPARIGCGLTHEEARREAGLLGIEAYVSRLAENLLDTNEFVGIGAGETAEEAVIRGLQACLAQSLAVQAALRQPDILPVRLSEVEDERCRYYLQSLTVMRGAPVIGLGEAVSGFPVVWIGTGDGWFGSADLNPTLALENALKAALLRIQSPAAPTAACVLEARAVRLAGQSAADLPIPSSEQSARPRLKAAAQVLNHRHKQLYVADLAVEPFLREELGGVYGVLLREGGTR
ncbi:hypothetical protein PAESOLCIP111_00328 [Paenibacillus solanacearum]|uniref:Thiazole-containing bacteriocin maturation protein n=1 Tax=Paenibacillus solanacearum TaxID=2048548 RepID=A0A916JSA7_9BACL|nr:putative thiazole-containing bacteriocin maturation protein [Paenibacillus solanacearum]CAG7599658.1 hypothetical protein PAESOLCIP111_00328 [Paenibacillus solanacearum]